MAEITHERLKREIAQENLCTVCCMAVGLVLAYSWLWSSLHSNDAVLAVIFMILSAIWSYKLYASLRDRGLAWLGEVVLWTSSFMALPINILVPSIGTLPISVLASRFEKQGRPALYLPLYQLCNIILSISPLSPQLFKLLLRTQSLDGLYIAGKMEECAKMAREVASSTTRLYEQAPSDKNREIAQLVNSVCASFLLRLGFSSEAATYWDQVKSFEQFQIATPQGRLYIYATIAESAYTMGDFETCCRYAPLALHEFNQVNRPNKLMLAEFTAAYAGALLELGNIDQATRQLSAADDLLRSCAGPSSHRMIMVHCLRARLGAINGNIGQASEQLETASLIAQARHMNNASSLLKIVETRMLVAKCASDDEEVTRCMKELQSIRQSLPGNDFTLPRQVSAVPPVNATNPPSAAIVAEDKPLEPPDLGRLIDQAVSRSNVSSSNLTLASFVGGIIISSLLVNASAINALNTAIMFLCSFCYFAVLGYWGRCRSRLTSKRLKATLSVENSKRVSMYFEKKGRFFGSFLGFVHRGDETILPSTSYYLQLPSNVYPPLFKDQEPSPAEIFLEKTSAKPVMIVSQSKDAFLVDKGWLRGLDPIVRSVLAGAKSTILCVTIVALFFFSVALQAPLPDQVPEGRSSKGYYGLGLQYRSEGRIEDSRQCFTRSIALDHSKEQQTAEKSKNCLRLTLPHHTISKEAEQLNIQACRAQGSKAEALWLVCIRKYPDFEWPYEHLGTYYVNKKQFQKGDSLLETALKTNPDYLEAWVSLANSKISQHDIAGARHCIAEAAKLDSNDFSVQVLRGALALTKSETER